MDDIKGKDLIVEIDKVVPNSWNPKESIEESKENKKYYEEIKEEIRKKGLFEAITVREVKGGWEILDGFHRWTACKELGFKKIRVNTLGVIDDKLARAITLIKEQKKVPLSELGVAEVVNWFQEEGLGDSDIMDLLGYDEDTFKEYEGIADFNWENYDNIAPDTSGIDTVKGQEVECPECHHKFNI